MCSCLPERRWISLFVPTRGCPGHLAIGCAAELLTLCAFLPRRAYFVFGCAHLLSDPDCFGCPVCPLFAGSPVSVSSRIFLIVFKLTLWSWLEMSNGIEAAVSPCRALLETHLLMMIPPMTNTWDVGSRFLIHVCSSLLMCVAAFAIRSLMVLS